MNAGELLDLGRLGDGAKFGALNVLQRDVVKPNVVGGSRLFLAGRVVGGKGGDARSKVSE